MLLCTDAETPRVEVLRCHNWLFQWNKQTKVSQCAWNGLYFTNFFPSSKLWLPMQTANKKNLRTCQFTYFSRECTTLPNDVAYITEVSWIIHKYELAYLSANFINEISYHNTIKRNIVHLALPKYIRTYSKDPNNRAARLFFSQEMFPPKWLHWE